ncbi:MAG: hypothetical protein II940_04690 [Methanosarcinaceae archaeon]|nr:hypothetical protein [Methanosarcinaceae archaeon]
MRSKNLKKREPIDPLASAESENTFRKMHIANGKSVSAASRFCAPLASAASENTGTEK